MVGKILNKIFGSRNERLIKQMMRTVDKINALEPEISSLSDEALKQKTDEFRERYKAGESLDALLPESFAVVREAGKRVLNMRHFDVQLIGGIVLHNGKIAEMRTGEGKTLVATLAAYLNAIPGEGVHIVTVNDYLAKRDAEWMGQLYGFLGMTTGVIIPDLSPEEKIAAYNCDIAYATNNELGFDYLRDNMVYDKSELTQRKLNFAIVDEVDSILIDEARTPLIISGPTEESPDYYTKINQIVPQLERQEKEVDPTDRNAVDTGDFTVDEKSKQVYLTERGHEKVEKLLTEIGLIPEGTSLYDSSNIILMHHVNAALRAHALYQKNVDYMVQNGEVVIVDEFTGRTLPGRRWSDGLHQAIEAKEGVRIEPENQTLASITFQNLFRLYDKLAGMTGTADTEAFEFQQIYGLEVVVIPTNLPMARVDHNDLIFLNYEDKLKAIARDVKECHERGQPVLVGTTSIEMSETISAMLDKYKIKHEVLNAKQHEREAHIVAEAGKPGAVTIATNMAGRGTDIVLGGNLEVELKNSPKQDEVSLQRIRDNWKKRHQQVVEAGGLHIIGTERHESRRIDNQLRGRAGRQGDPGSTRFYLSLQDNLMRIFASDRVASIMARLGMEDGEPIEHGLVNRAIEKAQRTVEAHNFDIRKNLLEYDDVANEQRMFVYAQRRQLMDTNDISDRIAEMREEVVGNIVNPYIPLGSIEEQWDAAGLEAALEEELNLKLPVAQWLEQDRQLNAETLREKISDELGAAIDRRLAELDEQERRDLERTLFLDRLDHHWKEHLAAMDHLRQSIHLQGYAQKNPKQEYKRIAFEMFREMLSRIQFDVIHMLAFMNVETDAEFDAAQKAFSPEQMQYRHDELSSFGDEEEQPEPQQPYVREGRKVGRNEPCPCGSGKKYKQCCGKLT